MIADRIKAGLLALIHGELARFDYAALYPADVVAQNTDLSLELRVLDARIPELSHVPIRHGIPGAQVKVTRGGRVLVGFENADPRKPFAALWDGATLTELTLTADTLIKVDAARVELGDGERPVARVGDVVEIPFVPAMIVNGTLDGAPFTGVLTIADPLLLGVITGGQTSILA